ncbi:MAG: succinyl-diaminopimelate desuccinylase [Myxococcota bacterium]
MSLRQRLIDRTLELIQIPSVTGQEAALGDHLMTLIPQLAPDVSLHRVGSSVLAFTPSQPGRPTIGLFGHTDTVRPAPDQPVGVFHDRIFGCGASDMKAALAVMLELLQEHRGLTRANLVFVFYDKEEGPWVDSGMGPVLEAGLLPPLDLALCLEPTDNVIQVGCVGTLHLSATVRGRRAHSARPWQGDNAVTRALPLLQQAAAWTPRDVSFGDISFREVMSVTLIEGGTNRNVIPDQVKVNVNFRFAPGRAPEEAVEICKQHLLAGYGDALPPEGIQFDVIDLAPSGKVYPDEPLLRAWQQAEGLRVEPKQAWTDVARLTQLGIPAVNFGPGETAQAHQARESISIELLVEGHRLLRALLRSDP